MPSDALPKTTTNLLTISPLWLIQLMTKSAHIGVVTYISAFVAAKTTSQILIPTYVLLCSTYLTYLLLTIYEVIQYNRVSLTSTRYLRLQYLKIYISFLELAVLGILVVLGENDDEGIESVLKQIIGLTAISRIPLLFGPVLSWVLWSSSNSEEDRPGAAPSIIPDIRVIRPRAATRDFGVFEDDGERRPLLIKIDPPPPLGEEEV